jgi:hypothetical protein
MFSQWKAEHTLDKAGQSKAKDDCQDFQREQLENTGGDLGQLPN